MARPIVLVGLTVLLCGVVLAGASKSEVDALEVEAARGAEEEVSLLELDENLLRPSRHRQHRRARHNHEHHRFADSTTKATSATSAATTAASSSTSTKASSASTTTKASSASTTTKAGDSDATTKAQATTKADPANKPVSQSDLKSAMEEGNSRLKDRADALDERIKKLQTIADGLRNRTSDNNGTAFGNLRLIIGTNATLFNLTGRYTTTREALNKLIEQYNKEVGELKTRLTTEIDATHLIIETGLTDAKKVAANDADLLNTKLKEESKARERVDTEQAATAASIADDVQKLKLRLEEHRYKLGNHSTEIKDLQAKNELVKNKVEDLTKELDASQTKFLKMFQVVDLDLEGLHKEVTKIYAEQRAMEARNAKALDGAKKDLVQQIQNATMPIAKQAEANRQALDALRNEFTRAMNDHEKRFGVIDNRLSKHRQRLTQLDNKITVVRDEAAGERAADKAQLTEFMNNLSRNLKNIMDQVFTKAKNFHAKDDAGIKLNYKRLSNLGSELKVAKTMMESYKDQALMKIKNERAARMTNVTYHNGLIAKLQAAAEEHGTSINFLNNTQRTITEKRTKQLSEAASKLETLASQGKNQQKDLDSVMSRLNKLEITYAPSFVPTAVPTAAPTAAPTHQPTATPTAKPTPVPTYPIPVTAAPTTAAPSYTPTPAPTPAITNVCEGRTSVVSFLEEEAEFSPESALYSLQKQIGGQWTGVASRKSGEVIRENPCAMLSSNNREQIKAIDIALDDITAAPNGIVIGNYAFPTYVQVVKGKSIVARLNNIYAIAYRVPNSGHLILHITVDNASWESSVVGIDAFSRST